MQRLQVLWSQLDLLLRLHQLDQLDLVLLLHLLHPSDPVVLWLQRVR